MKKLAIFVAAFVLTLGLAQCKKEQPTAQNLEGETVYLTVKVGNGSRADIADPSNSGHYTFNDGDILYVGYNGAKVGGELTYSTSTGKFSGELTIAQDGNDKPLYFYYMGGTTATMVDATHYTVDISNQISNYPVISCGTSSDPYTGTGAYTTTLLNQCALVKFTTDASEDIVVKGLNNTVEVNFNGNTLSYSQTNGGAITLHPDPESATSRWAILLPQAVVTKGDVYTVDGVYVGMRPAIEGGIVENQYLSEGIEIFDPLTTALTFKALTEGTIEVNRPKDGMQYSKNGGDKTTMSDYTEINVAVGDKVTFYGNGTNINNYDGTWIEGTAQVKAYGNIMSLIDETGFETATTVTSNCFNGLFGYNTALTDASGLLLPATVLNERCYFQMFGDCTSLTTAPMLPAETLAKECYAAMFKGCSGLTTAPTLPAPMLADGCYHNMFNSCTSLTTAPALPATTLVLNCYDLMFSNCSSLNSVTCLATGTVDDIPFRFCIGDWLEGVASTGTFTKASGTTWPKGDGGIPIDWTVIEQ